MARLWSGTTSTSTWDVCQKVMFRSIPAAVYFLLLSAHLSWQQKDPLNDFCRRFGHQTAAIDRKLYIDGGLVDWNPISANNQNYSNTWLLYNDLNTSPGGNVGQPQLYANLSKNSTIPDVSGGVLWADEVNKRFFLYGGDYYQAQPSTYNLLSYDALYNQWESFGPPQTSLNSVSYGGGIGVSDIGKGYMYGGWASNASIPGWTGGPLATTGLIEYDMDSGSWTNNSGPDTTPRAEGAMVYLPASVGGLLVYFGGISTAPGNSTTNPEAMTDIHIYDIQSGRWYNQTAKGDVPASRRRFCAGAAWAPDQSSYNIYIYGGAGFGPNATGFDDVYILTLPSFKWIKWWTADPSSAGPHNTLTCNVIDGAQMIVIGGTFPSDPNRCDSPPTWGTHNLNLGKQNSNGNMWFNYQPNITSYQVPSEIISVVGGGATGGATATAPAGEYDNRDLAVFFTQRASAASRTPTRAITTQSSSSSSSLSSGAIAGIVVGAVVGALALFIGACCIFRHHRRRVLDRRQAAAFPGPQYAQSPHPSYQQYPFSSHDSHSPHRMHSSHAGSPQVTEYQQLPASPIAMPPFELAGNSSDTPKTPKSGLYQPVPEEQHPAYAPWPQQPASRIASSHTSIMSTPVELRVNDQQQIPETRPAPTYSSIVPHSSTHSQNNQTCYNR